MAFYFAAVFDAALKKSANTTYVNPPQGNISHYLDLHAILSMVLALHLILSVHPITKLYAFVVMIY